MIANALPRPLTAGSVDNAILRADGTGGATLQNSDLNIDDATVTTQANVAITNQHSGQTNSALVLTPKGTGALIAGPKPDGTATGGNARGANAVDLQTSRSAATQVASGPNSFAVGSGNTAFGSAAIALGNSCSAANTALAIGFVCNASGTNSIALGGRSAAIAEGAVALGGRQAGAAGNTASGIISAVLGGDQSIADRRGMQAHSAGSFSNSISGDAQRARFVLRNKTTTNSAVELFLDGSSTRLTIPSGKVLALTINISGISSTGAAVAHYMRQYALKNVSGTCTEIYAPVTLGADNAAGTSIAISAGDDANGEYLKVSVTGTASTIWRWVASVDAVEIAFGT